MKVITLDKHKMKFPENWNELSLNQLLGLYTLLLPGTIKGSKSLAKSVIIIKLIAPNLFNFRFFFKFMELPKHMVVQVFFPLIEFLTESNTLTEFKLKSFRVGLTRYYAPADGLNNITIDEFRWADKMYIKYKQTNDTDWLDGLVAILYRKKRKDYNPTLPTYKGDIREDFNEFTISKNSEKVDKISLDKKHIILLAYEGSRNKQIEACEHLFSDTQKSSGKKSGYGTLLLELSGTKFGTYEQTCKTNWKLAFTFLENEAEKLSKLKRA
jgi:hypothetical protein